MGCDYFGYAFVDLGHFVINIVQSEILNTPQKRKWKIKFHFARKEILITINHKLFVGRACKNLRNLISMIDGITIGIWASPVWNTKHHPNTHDTIHIQIHWLIHNVIFVGSILNIYLLSLAYKFVPFHVICLVSAMVYMCVCVCVCVYFER